MTWVCGNEIQCWCHSSDNCRSLTPHFSSLINCLHCCFALSIWGYSLSCCHARVQAINVPTWKPWKWQLPRGHGWPVASSLGWMGQQWRLMKTVTPGTVWKISGSIHHGTWAHSRILKNRQPPFLDCLWGLWRIKQADLFHQQPLHLAI